MAARPAALLIALTTVAFAAMTSSAAPRLVPATSPERTIDRLALIYHQRSLEALDSLLTSDFRWHFHADPTDSTGLGYSSGWGRESELEIARNMFVGNPETGRPPAKVIFVQTGELALGVDPEHPDSTCQYRLVVANGISFRLIESVGRGAATSPNLEVFHVVRGDAAVLGPGQIADSTHWYIRRWVGDIDALTLSLQKVDGECGGDPGVEVTVPGALSAPGLRAIGAPLCPTLKVLCDLPGTEPAQLDVYDLQGRRVAQRTVAPQSPGSVLLEAGSGQRFTPGAYWVRLSQGRRPPVTRMVMVAR